MNNSGSTTRECKEPEEAFNQITTQMASKVETRSFITLRGLMYTQPHGY